MSSLLNRQVLRLLLVVAGMFAFGFAMVPLYDVICDITGLNGRNSNMLTATEALPQTMDTDRLVTVEFVTTVNSGTRMAFKPNVHKIKVHPGSLETVTFYAENLGEAAMVGQAVPSVRPGTAAGYLHKTECFCFRQQAFAAHEGRDMPMRFVLDPELPEHVEVVTLSYTFFDITERAES